MELTTTNTSVNHQETAEQDGYSLTATVSLSDGVITSIYGNISKEDKSASFSTYNSGEDMRMNVSDLKLADASAMTALAAAMVAAVKAKYEG